ncbi:MAG TPA: EAL domain-containing protein [Steroidobacteraceae bacterium]|jgi:diguanylate cyclase (GGDEF)-like protein
MFYLFTIFLDRIRGAGIVARLSLSFVAVAALAVAANFLADHSSMIRTTRVERVGVPIPISAPTRKEVETPSVLRIGPAQAFSQAVERYEQAMLERSAASESDHESAQQAAEDQLLNATRAYAAQLQPVDPDMARQVLDTSNMLKATGSTLERLEQDRQRTIADYRRHWDNLQAAVQPALQNSFKLFARQSARQALESLVDSLTLMRQRLDTAVLSGNPAPGLRAAAEAERRFAQTIETDSDTLRRAQSDNWIATLRDEAAAVSGARENLEALGPSIETQLSRFAAAKMAASARVPQGLLALHDQRSATTRSEEAAPQPAALAPVPLESPVETVTVMPRDSSRDVLIGWITAAATLLVLFISVVTVRSIIGPVRRLLNAAERLSKGDTEVRVKRGGLKELDKLAGAFNQMAHELAKANEINHFYQSRLESDVAARTVELKELAERDPLTQLPNRRHWLTLIDRSLHSARSQGHHVGVFFIDLDNFKTINDSLGHAYGDKILRTIAQRLESCSDGFGYAARLGGDEFSVVYENARSSEEIYRAGSLLIQAFHAPIVIDQRELVVSVSAGLSLFPDHGTHPDELLSAADAALFRAKSLGRNQLNVFTPDLLQSASEKFSTEQRLRRAIDRNEFELVFQPEVAVTSLKVIAVEALLRWRQPDGRLATPTEFLAVAEASGFMTDIDRWVLEAAVTAASRWYHGDWPEVRIALNVSPRQMMDAGFLERLLGLLARHRLPVRCIEIELTETVLQTGTPTIQMLRKIRDQGIAIALDDFGTGYSSLTSLEQLPLSRVKLDRSLIAGLGVNERSAAIARAIITMCEHLQLEVTAEGIESHEQLAWLVHYRGLALQGYLISRPLSFENVVASMNQLHQQMTLAVLSAPTHAAKSTVTPLSVVTRLRDKG